MRDDAPHSRALFWILGGAQVALWFAFAVLSKGFAYGTDPLARPFGVIAVVAALAFLLYLGSVFRFWRDVRIDAWHVLFLAAAMRLPLILGSQPVQEIDFYRYLWDGRVVVNGVSPYRFSPADLDDALAAAPDAREGGEAAPLLALLERSPEVRAGFERIDHREVPTIYPPVTQTVFAVAALLTPEGASIATKLTVLRSLMALFDLGVVALLLAFLRERGIPVARAMAYAWCPLVLKEFANSAHMDVIAIFLVTAAWFFMARAVRKVEATTVARGAVWPSGEALAAAALWAGAVLAKWYPLILAPLFLSLGWRYWGRRVVLPVALAIAVLAVGHLPLRTGSPVASVEVAHDQHTGLRAFFERWEINDLLFSVVHENLRPRRLDESGQGDHQPWYAVTPDRFRRGWNDSVNSAASRFGIGEDIPAPAFLTAQAVAGGIVLGLALWLAIQPWPPGRSGEVLAQRCFLVLAVAWFVSATQNPWYWAWCLPFAAFARTRAWLLVSGVALIYYLRFWLIYRFPEPMWAGLNGRQFFDEIVVWMEHLPMIGLLVVLAWWRWRRGEPVELSDSQPQAP